jgi:hypothetical protein
LVRTIGLTIVFASLFFANSACAGEARRLIVNVNPKGGYFQFEAYGFSCGEIVRIVEVTSGCKVDLPEISSETVDMRLGSSRADTVLRALFEANGYIVEERQPQHFVVTKVTKTATDGTTRPLPMKN